MDKILTEKELNGDSPNKEKKRKLGKRKYIIYIFLVLAATALALFLSLKDNAAGVIEAFRTCNYLWVLAILGLVVGYFILDGFAIFIFMKLYSRKYHFHSAMSVKMIGSFYEGITPGASGGQVMQAYTLKKQGVQISNAASILVMYFILYRVMMTILSVCAVIFKYNLLISIGSIPIKIGNWSMNISLVPLTIIAFVINIAILGLLFLMSYSHRIHNFIMHYGVGFLARIKIVKHPDETRETLRIQVENFKIELRRLLSNIPVAILILIIFFLANMARLAIPWFAGMALNGYGEIGVIEGVTHYTTGTNSFVSMFDACFMSCYHELITGLIPIPGGAGISEILFSKLFENFYKTGAIISASQILWRASTYHLVLIVTGIFSALYKSTPKEQALQIDRKTFVTLQFSTFEERKKSSDSAFETIQISRKELQNRIKGVIKHKEKKEEDINNLDKRYILDDSDLNESSPFELNEELIESESDKKKKHKKGKDDITWRDIDL